MGRDAGGLEDWGQEPSRSEFDPRIILDFLRRRKLVILLVALPLLLPASIYPFMVKPFYEATATIVIRTPPKVMEFGADFMPGSGSDPRMPGRFGGNTSESAMITLVYSDAVLGRVVDQLPAGRELSKSLLQRASEIVGREPGEALTPDQERANKIEAIRRFATATVTGGGTYLRITTVATSPGGATFFANAIADAYVKHQETEREEASRRAVAWLNQQAYELREQASRKEQLLAELVATHGLSVVALEDDDGSSENSALEQVESDLQTARIELLSAQERLAALVPRADRASSSQASDPAVAGLREQYAKAVADLEAVKLRFMPTHPEVRRLEATVQTLAERLGSDAVQRRPLSPAEETEYQALLAQESQQRARVKVLEKSRQELTGSTGPKSEAASRYRRVAKEVALDKQILEVLLTRRNETLLSAATKEVGAEVLDYAVAPSVPSGPNRKKYLIAGVALAVALGFGMAILLELLDRRVRDPDSIALLLGTTSLGMIPMVDGRDAPPERQAADSPGSVAGESYRNVRTSLLFAMRNSKLRCLLVTSAIAGEGKTTTCVNLAGAFGRMGRRVLLVDADLRRPRVHRVFRLPASPGLSEVLQGKARVEDAVVRPANAEFDLLPAGSVPENPSELLCSTAFAHVVAEAKAEYDLVVFDSAVLLAVPDALLLSAEADGTLLVSKPGSVDRRALRRMRADLERSGARVLGVIFNQVDPTSNPHYGSYMYSPYLKDEGRSKSSSDKGKKAGR